MKKINKFLLSTLSVGSLVLVGAGLGAKTQARADEVASTPYFEVTAASVRTIDEQYSAGIRFQLLMDKASYQEGMVAGAKLVPAYYLGGEDIATSKNEHIVTVTTGAWKEYAQDTTKMEGTVYVYDVPESNYGTDLVIAGYSKVGDVVTHTTAKTFTLAEVAMGTPNSPEGLKEYYTFQVSYDNGATTSDVVYGASLNNPSSEICAPYTNVAGTAVWDFDDWTVTGDVVLKAGTAKSAHTLATPSAETVADGGSFDVACKDCLKNVKGTCLTDVMEYSKTAKAEFNGALPTGVSGTVQSAYVDGVQIPVSGGVLDFSACAIKENSVVTVVTENGAYFYRATIWTNILTDESDWWAMYKDEAALTGSYKLANDITLTQNSCSFVTDAYQINYSFTGVIDGNGKTLTYDGARLFHQVKGTIKNITLNAGSGYYWGMTVAFDINGATLENIDINANISNGNTFQYAGGFLEQPAAGVIAVWITNTKIVDCDINVTLTGTATSAYYAAIGYTTTGSTITNVHITANVAMDLNKVDGGNNTITNTEVTVDDGFVEISTEEDWWAIYENDTTLAGNYRLKNDIKLTKPSVTLVADGHTVPYTFTGIIDGNGKTLTYSDARLFHAFNGTIKNITLNAGTGYYWGATIAFHVTGATIENVNVTAEINRNSTYQYAGGFILAPGSGTLGVWITNTKITNCNVNVKLTGEATAAYNAGIGYELNGCTVDGVSITSNVAMDLYKSQVNSTVTNSEVTVDDGFTLISTEEEWWAIYESAETLAGNYRLKNDITLTQNSASFVTDAYQINYSFAGVIDGNGKTLTDDGARLFHQGKGTIKNITLNAGSGYYWGMTVAFDINGATLENIDINANISNEKTFQYAGGGFLEQPAAGVIAVWITNTKIVDCDINVTLTGAATSAYYAAIGYTTTGSTITNVHITANVAMDLNKVDGGNNTITNTEVTVVA